VEGSKAVSTRLAAEDPDTHAALAGGHAGMVHGATGSGRRAAADVARALARK